MYCEIVYKSGDEKIVVPERMGTPKEDQLQGSVLDQLAELAGRSCYDSLGNKTSRSSKDYHAHIWDVKHLSTIEHCNITVQFDKSFNDWYNIFLNRPGVYVYCKDGVIQPRITINLRSILEWNNYPKINKFADEVGKQLKELAKAKAPLVCQHLTEEPIEFTNNLKPKDMVDEEIWVSMFMQNVSRGLTHELVRHGDWTAISQRSTRFVNESESPYCWHPLIKKYHDKIVNNGDDICLQNMYEDQDDYNKIVEVIQAELVNDGVDKFTARKQARGAARGILGNALETQLIFSANLAQWKRMILMRAHPAADAEIRVVFNEAFELLEREYPERFSDFTKQECSDKIGYGITKENK